MLITSSPPRYCFIRSKRPSASDIGQNFTNSSQFRSAQALKNASAACLGVICAYLALSGRTVILVSPGLTPPVMPQWSGWVSSSPGLT